MNKEPFWNNLPTIRQKLDVLFGGDRFYELNFWKTQPLASMLNAITRVVLISTAVLSILLLLSGNIVSVGILLILAGIVLLTTDYYYSQHSQNQVEEWHQEAMEEGPINKLPPKINMGNPFEDGVTSLDNPYGNPLPYDNGEPVRSKRPSPGYFKDESLRRMYKGVDENLEGYFFNEIPDPTLMARTPYNKEDPHPDIVSKEAAGDRLYR